VSISAIVVAIDETSPATPSMATWMGLNAKATPCCRSRTSGLEETDMSASEIARNAT
jgi:hypothetical protein